MGQGIDCRSPFAALGAHRPEELFSTLPTPCYILDEAQLRRNGKILSGVAARTGCKILLAQKAFSNYDLYPVLATAGKVWTCRQSSGKKRGTPYQSGVFHSGGSRDLRPLCAGQPTRDDKSAVGAGDER